MSENFFDIEYLRHGSPQQVNGYNALIKTGVMDILHEFEPVLAGTLPWDIFIEGSDLDILCYAVEMDSFEKITSTHFSGYADFTVERTQVKGVQTMIARFRAEEFDFEIFAQPVPVRHQFAFRHLVIGT